MTKHKIISDINSSSSVWNIPILGTATQISPLEITSDNPSQRIAPNDDLEAIETAVYNYILAIRALGRTTINTVEISNKLSVSLRKIDLAIARLRDKDVGIV